MIVKRGKIIVIEGTDCSGKETQTRLLLERLKREGIICDTISFPQYGSASGDIVGDCYLGKSNRGSGGSWFGEADKVDPKVASLYYAADRRFWRPKILDVINSGKNIIIDRYYTSNMGHQGGKIITTEERQKMFDWLEELELRLTKLPKEDIVIFLYMPFEVSQILKSRRNEGNLNNVDRLDGHEINPDHLRRAEQAYLELAERYNWITIECAPDKTMNSLKSIEQIHEEVYEKIIELIKGKTAIEDIEKKIMKLARKREKEKGFQYTPELAYLQLTEELGEVARQLSNKKMRQDLFDNNNLKDEIADVILESIILGKLIGMDIGKQLDDKINDLLEKHRFDKD